MRAQLQVISQFSAPAPLTENIQVNVSQVNVSPHSGLALDLSHTAEVDFKGCLMP
jgi:hypothetical protein